MEPGERFQIVPNQLQVHDFKSSINIVSTLFFKKLPAIKNEYPKYVNNQPFIHGIM